MFLTGTHLSRRAVLRGLGATVALPFLDAMIPARRLVASAAVRPRRLVCVEIVHGAAGSSEFGSARHMWSPALTGTAFDLAPTSLRSLEPFRDRLTVVSHTDVRPADPSTAREIGGDHFRSSAVFLTQARPRRTEGPDIQAGVSLDQIVAQRIGQDTPLPSMQLCIEPVDQAGGCQYGYSCVYVDTISWASPTRPLPMVRDPRVVFDALFGAYRDGMTPEERRARLAENRSVLDGVTRAAGRLAQSLSRADLARLADYLDNVREVERRLQAVETRGLSGEPREIPSAPDGVPDSFSEHVRIMFELQALAFQSDLTRVVAFKLGRDGSDRSYPESGARGGFHSTSHHGGREERVRELADINAYHVSQIPPFLERLQALPDGDGTLLDHTVLLYGSPMGDPNLHNHKRVPFFVIGRDGTRLPGGRHLRAPDRTPLANVMLGLLRVLGCENIERFGDSTGVFDLAGA
jgi:hypothetical protein